MNRLQEIKESFNKGRMRIDDIKILIDLVESQDIEIKDYEQSMTRARKVIRELRAGAKG